MNYKQVGAVANAVSILRALAQLAGPVGVTSVARATGISASTCFNILRTLAHERLISFDPVAKTYAMGVGVLEFSLPILGSNQADIIRPELDRLSEAHRTLICLWQLVKSERIILIDRAAASHIVHVQMPRGARLPAYAGAIGRCYAAHMNLGDGALRNAFEQVKWQSPLSFDKYRQQVEAARRDGYALDSGQLYTSLEIAAALIVDSSATARLGISGIAIAGTRSAREMQELGADLRDTAEWISEVLFGVPRGTLRGRRRLSQAAPPVKRRQKS